MNRSVSAADRIWQSYVQRMGISDTAARDAQFNYSLNVLHDVLQRLDVIMRDEGVPPEIANRIMRCLIYGAPSEADALERVRQQQEMAKVLATSAPPLRISPDDDGAWFGVKSEPLA